MDQYNLDYEDEGRVREDRLLLEFGKRLRLHRKQKGLTQQELGDRAGVSYKYLGEVERGEKNPTVIVILKIAAALGVNPAVLLCLSNKGCLNCHFALPHIGPIYEILADKDPKILGKVFRVLKEIFAE